jgi:hypothetical protein
MIMDVCIQSQDLRLVHHGQSELLVNKDFGAMLASSGLEYLWRYFRRSWIGPFFPSNPSRNGGRSRIVNIDKLKYAGKHAKPVDVLNVESTAISQRAQRR